jgi:hypothetical protein
MHNTMTLQEHKWNKRIMKDDETVTEINISHIKNPCKSGLNIQKNSHYFDGDGKHLGSRNKGL